MNFGIGFDQYKHAYPKLTYDQPPAACNGYGWQGNGYGFQVDPAAWKSPSIYPNLEEVVEEPEIKSQKVETQEASLVSKLKIKLVYSNGYKIT